MSQPRESSCPRSGGGEGEELVCRSVEETKGLDHLFEDCLPAFGGATLRRVWLLLDEAIGRGIPMALSVAGPVTLSGQGNTWLNPLLDSGWFMLVSTTDAVCYHDGHRALKSAPEHPFFHVDIHGNDGMLRDERTIRVTDIGFDEEVLLDQDRFLREVLRGEAFQRRMSGTEFRWLLGRAFAEQEQQHGVSEGLLALCHRKSIPIFVGAPSDGSVFLNSLFLWSMRKAFGDAHAFDLDLHLEIFESCAFHRWGVTQNDAKAIGTFVLGGGVPKNFSLQPEPTLSQILGFEDVPGYLYDIQITTAPVTDGSLSSCYPAEAVTWGKVDKDEYRSTCVSLPADYTMVLPFLVKALLAKRTRFEELAEKLGREELAKRHPESVGYLREKEGYRLYDRREELTESLLEEIRAREAKMRSDA
jgi:deoxyhypusine synthase